MQMAGHTSSALSTEAFSVGRSCVTPLARGTVSTFALRRTAEGVAPLARKTVGACSK